jgi:hypothetical protein
MKGFAPNAKYSWTWFNPRTGEWSRAVKLSADAAGVLTTPQFPTRGTQAVGDFAAKILRAP